MGETQQHPDLTTLEWWTVREVANRFRVDKTTITRLIRAGKIKAIRFGRDFRIHNSEVERIRAQGMRPDPQGQCPPQVPPSDEWAAPQYA